MGTQWGIGDKTLEADDVLSRAIREANDVVAEALPSVMRAYKVALGRLADTQAELAALKAERGMESMGFEQVDKLRDAVVEAAIDWHARESADFNVVCYRLDNAVDALLAARQPRQSQAGESNDRS